MAEAGASIRTIDSAIARFSRTHTTAVLKAYSRLASLAMCSTPRDHALWIFDLSRGTGIVVVSIADVAMLRNRMELGCRFDASESVTFVSIEDFDPTMHALLCTEPSVVSYMESNPDDILGTNANVVAPTFKCTLVWWTCA